MDTIPAEAAPTAAPHTEQSGLKSIVRFLLLLFVAALMLRSFIVAPFSIPSGSMLPRMMIGDYLFVAKWPYGYSRYSFPLGIGGFEGRFFNKLPDRGDVVVFRYPGSQDDYVKRVIGLPGDSVQMERGTLILNGKAVPKVRIADFLLPLSPNSPCRFLDPARERRVAGPDGRTLCAYPRFRETLPGGTSYAVLDQMDGAADDSEAFIVPAGHLFVMGDNRDDSLDSRFAPALGGVGFLPVDNVIGAALITFFSTDGSAELVKPWTWASAARWDRVGETY